MASTTTIKRLTVEGRSVGLDKVTADLRAVSGAQDEVARSSEATAKVTETSARRQISASAAWERHRRSVDEAARAQSAFERGQNTINRALQQGVIEAEEAARAMSRVQDAYQAAGSRSSLNVDQSGLNRLLGVNDNQSGAARASAAAFEEAAREADQLAAKADALRASLDPVAAAQQRLNAELAEYNRLASAGAISSGELAQANAAAHQRFSAFVEPLDNIGKKTGLATHQMTNFGYQVNDAATMLLSGSSPFQVMATQGGQVAQILGSAPGGVGAALASIMSATVGLAATLSPFIAVAGLGAAAVWTLQSQINATTKETVSFGNTFMGIIDTIGDGLSYVMKQLGETRIAKWFDDQWDLVIKGFSTVVNHVGRGSLVLTSTLKQAFGSIPDLLRIAGQNGANFFLDALEKMLNTALSKLGEFSKWLKDTFKVDLGAEDLQVQLPRVDIGADRARASIELRARAGEKEREGYKGMNSFDDQLFGSIRENALERQREDNKKKSKGRQPRESEYERDTEQLKEQTAALLDQAHTMGMTEAAATRYTVAQDLLRAAAESGMPITTQLTEQISATANAYAEAQLKLEGARMEVENRSPFEAMHAELARLEELKNAGAISWGTYSDSVVKARAQAHVAVAGMASDAVGILGQLFENNKAVAVAEAIVSTYQGVAKALGAYPPPFNYAMAAGVLAMGMKQVASIRSTTKSTKSASGSVGGGAASGAGQSAPAAPSEPSKATSMTIVLKGDTYTKQNARDLIETINDALKDGHVLNLQAA
jgi:ribosomal protein S20